jgi:hypothetical protein
MKIPHLSHYLTKTPPMESARPLHCVFYSHVWNIYALAETGLVNPKTDVILELATGSNFAPTLNPFGSYHENLLTLLQTNKHLHRLGTRFKGIPAPVVLAPASANLATMLSALALVITDNSPVANALVMVHINDAPKFATAYPMMATFSVLWDIADAPNADLPLMAKTLVAEECLDERRWGGIHFCQHPQRQLPDHQERTAALTQLLNSFPAIKAA